MVAAINFLAGLNLPISNLAGSGLGFYGVGGFGGSVQVGFWQGRTFITDSNGVNQGPEAPNVQYLNAASGILGQVGTGIALTCIPNYQATLNIEFTNDTPCQTQNIFVTIYDRTSPNNPASGVTTAVAEIIHANTTQSNTGSGNTTWQFPAGTGMMQLVNSPGTSGLSPNGAATVDTRHDWYIAMSASPNSIGSKTQFGMFVELEYL